MKILNVKIQSICPMLMHSDRTANPFDSFTKEIKKFTAKRKKTDEDLEQIAKLEWEAGLYYNSEKRNYYLPAALLFAMLFNSAKNFKQGPTLKKAVVIPNDGTFVFSDDKLTPKQLYKEGYIDLRSVRVGTSKVMRCRPIFKEWSSEFQLFLDDDQLNLDDFNHIVTNAGKYIGIGDFRPQYGRFEVINVTESK